MPAGKRPSWPQSDVLRERRALLDEELAELEHAEDGEDLAGWISEIVDVIYILLGTTIAAGVDLRPVWRAIHDANISKVASRGGSSKPEKPLNWSPADVAAILAAQKPSR